MTINIKNAVKNFDTSILYDAIVPIHEHLEEILEQNVKKTKLLQSLAKDKTDS